MGVGTRRLAARAGRGRDGREDAAGVRKERGKNMLPEPIKRNRPPKMCILIGVHDQTVKLETALKNLLESARADRDAVDNYEAQGKSSDSSEREFITAHTTRLDEIDALVGEVSSKLDDLRDLWLKR